MTISLTLARNTGGDVSNLTATPLFNGIKLNWDVTKTNYTYGTEVWGGTTNNRASATLLMFTIGDEWVDTTVTKGTPKYYWIRSRDLWGDGSGDWHPTSSTGGVSATWSGAVLADTKQTAVGSASFSTGGATATITCSDYNTWETNTSNYDSFTFNSDNGVVNAYLSAIPTKGSISGGSTGNVIQLWMRYRLYNYSDSVDVDGQTFQFLVYSAVYSGGWSEVLALQPIVQQNISFVAGFGGTIIKGKEYRIYLDLKRTRTGTPTVDFSCSTTYTTKTATATS